MARTILDIAIEAAERDATAPAPTALFGTNDRVARILRGAAKDTLREYIRQHTWQGLSEVYSTWVFALERGRYAYPLPPDFLRIIPGTEQRNGWPLGLLGPATPQAWAAWVFSGQAVAAPMGWRIRNNAIFIEPTPMASEMVAIEYISRYPVVSEIREGDYDLTKEPVQTIAPVVARDGWLEMESADPIYSSAAGASGAGKWDTADVGWDVGTWSATPSEILKRIDPSDTRTVLPEVRREGFTADTDKPFFDDDYLLSLGMTWRLRRALDLPFAEHAGEYEEEMAAKIASDAGGNSGFSLGSSDASWDAVPLGDGRWMVS